MSPPEAWRCPGDAVAVRTAGGPVHCEAGVADEDCDGYVSRFEMSAFLRKLKRLGEENVDELARQALTTQMENLDQDGSGMVSFDEIMWSVGMTAMHMEENRRRESYKLMRIYFERADIDEDGHISCDELGSFLHWEAEATAGPIPEGLQRALNLKSSP